MFDRNFVLKNFSGGWVTETLPDLIQPNESSSAAQSPELINVDFKSGSIKKAPGYSELGTDTDTTIKTNLIPSSYRSGSSLLFAKSGTTLKVLDETKKVWLTIMTGLTDSDRPSYQYFDSLLYLFNITGSAIKIDLSKTARLASDALLGATTITLVNSTALPASGTIYLNSTAVTYTGNTANQLTGCSGTPVSSAGDFVITAPVTVSGIKKGNITAYFAGRFFVAVGSNIYGSKLNSLEDFTVLTSGVGDAILSTLESEIKAMRVFPDQDGTPKLFIFTAYGARYSCDVDDNTTLSGTFFTKKIVPGGVTPISNEVMVSGTNDIFYVDSYNMIRSLGQSYKDRGITKVMSDVISLDHETLFKNNYNFAYTRGCFKDNELHLLATDGNGTYNNRCLIYDVYSQNWRKREDILANDIVVYKNQFVFCNAYDNKVMIIDGSLNNNQSPIRMVYETLDINTSHLCFEKLRRVRMMVKMSKNCQFNVKAYGNYKSTLLGDWNVVGSDEDIKISSISNSSLGGSFVWGEEVFGQDGDNEIGFFIMDLEMDANETENYRFVIENNQDGVYLEIFKIKPIFEVMPENYFPDQYIKKSN